MAAYHDGGQQDGQFYDSDSGGSIHVNGGEVLVVPAVSLAEHRTAKSEAKLMLSKFSSLGAGAGEEGRSVGSLPICRTGLKARRLAWWEFSPLVRVMLSATRTLRTD